MKGEFENLEQKMELILTVAQTLSENGATADRILRNSKRAALALKIPEENFNLQIMPSTLFLKIFDGEKFHTTLRQCTKHGINMDVLVAISKLTWTALRENYSTQKFQESLKAITERKRIYSTLTTVLATGFACGGFCFLFGGSFLSVIYTAICAIIGKTLQLKLLKWGVNEFIVIASTAFVATVAAYFAHFLPSETVWTPVIACALFLVPGVPIINSTINMLNNFLFNGMVLSFRAVLITISMTVGIVLAVEFSLFMNLEEIIGEVNYADFNRPILESLEHNLFEMILAAMSAAIGFSVIFNVPKRKLIVMGILGATAICIRNFFMGELNFSQEIATFSGALVVSILIVSTRKLTHTPMQILVVPPIIPMIPGVLIYRFLFSCININHLDAEEFFYALQIGADALQIIFLMVFGAALPNLIAGKIFERKNKVEQEKLLNDIYGKN